MTVEELIKRLQMMPQAAEVYLVVPGHRYQLRMDTPYGRHWLHVGDGLPCCIAPGNPQGGGWVDIECDQLAKEVEPPVSHMTPQIQALVDKANAEWGGMAKKVAEAQKPAAKKKKGNRP